jgi:hypothetical protein
MEKEETMRTRMAAVGEEAQAEAEAEAVMEDQEAAEAQAEITMAVGDGVIKEVEVVIEDTAGGRNSEVSLGGCGCLCIPGCLAAMVMVLDFQALVLAEVDLAEVSDSLVWAVWVWEEVDHSLGLVGQSTSQGQEQWPV